jgi:hypothetical protein
MINETGCEFLDQTLLSKHLVRNYCPASASVGKTIFTAYMRDPASKTYVKQTNLNSNSFPAPKLQIRNFARIPDEKNKHLQSLAAQIVSNVAKETRRHLEINQNKPGMWDPWHLVLFPVLLF